MGRSLEGRRVLITGGSSGIGAAVAMQSCAAGARVACLGRRSTALAAVAERTGAVVVAADIRQPAAVDAAIEKVHDDLGGIDALINSAGDYRPGPIAETTLDDWSSMFDVNVLGLLTVVQAALPALRASTLADIVNVSSMGGRRVAGVDSGVYSATKFAVHAISDALRRELFDDGIRVSVVAPGAVDTDFGLHTAEPAQRARIQERRRTFGLDAEDVARHVLAVLEQPPGVTVHEIALTSTRQPPI